MNPLQVQASKLEMSSEKVAKIAIRQMLRGKLEVVPGFFNKAHRLISRIIPSLLLEGLLGNTYLKYLPTNPALTMQ